MTCGGQLSRRRKPTHHLLDDLAPDPVLNERGERIALLGLLAHDLRDADGDGRVDVARLVALDEVDVLGAEQIAPERRVVLQTVAGAVLLDRGARLVRLGPVWMPQRRREIDHRRQRLPRIVGLGPPAPSVQRLIG